MKKLFGYFLLEFLSEIRERETIIWTFLFPLLLFFILNLTIGGAINQEENSISFRYTFVGKETIYDKFVKNIFAKISIFEKTPIKNLKEGISYLKKGEVDVVIFVDKDIKIYCTKERKASDLAKKVIEGIFNKINFILSLTLQYIKYYSLKNFILGAFGFDVIPFIKQFKPINYKVEGISSNTRKNFSYKDYLFPGLLLMAIITLGAFSIPLKITLYRETGILKRFFVTPLTPSVLFLGNLFSSFFIVAIQYIILALFSKYVMKVGIDVFSPLIILYALLTFSLSYSIGFAIATIANRPQTASILGNAIFFPLQFLGGLYFPVDNAPWIIRWFVLLNPLTYISSGIRGKIGLMASPYPSYLSFTVPLIWIGILFIFIISKFSWTGEKK